MSNPAQNQAERLSRVIQKDKQLRTNFEEAYLSDLVKVTESYSFADKNSAKMQILETAEGIVVKFAIRLDGWKPINYLP